MAAHFLPRCITEWETARGYLTLDNAAGLFILGVFANLFYCAAYPVDLLVQYARPRGARATWRIGLFLIGSPD
ncbi:MAG: hypothetical protein MUE73_04960 [Planctomycetes bacterium]|nr:hypothetical protein [Planctomycetota bacterium]